MPTLGISGPPSLEPKLHFGLAAKQPATRTSSLGTQGGPALEGSRTSFLAQSNHILIFDSKRWSPFPLAPGLQAYTVGAPRIFTEKDEMNNTSQVAGTLFNNCTSADLTSANISGAATLRLANKIRFLPS